MLKPWKLKGIGLAILFIVKSALLEGSCCYMPDDCCFNWTGFYAGINAGATWGDAHFTWHANPLGFGPTTDSTSEAGNGHLHSAGFTGGGQLGYNYQCHHLICNCLPLIGVEADLEYAGLGNTRHAISPIPDFGEITEKYNTNWMSTIRFRLGITPLCPWLIYATAGMAIGRVHYSDFIVFPDSATFNTASKGQTRMGWTAGGGIEWAFATCWSVKVESLYVDFGSTSYRSANSSPLFPDATINHSHRLREVLARVGLNFRFSLGYW